jgi:hypothetical protein
MTKESKTQLRQETQPELTEKPQLLKKLKEWPGL